MIEPQHDRRIKLQIKRNKNRYEEIQKKDIKRNKDDNKIEQNYSLQINRNKNMYDEVQKKTQIEIQTTEKQNRTIDQQKQKQVRRNTKKNTERDTIEQQINRNKNWYDEV